MTSSARPNDACPEPYGSKYGGERYDPTLPRCGDITLHFDGSRLRLAGTGIGPIDYKAVSGKPSGAPPSFDYSQAAQGRPGAGPIPQGVYWINPPEMWENAWYKSARASAWGNFRITIHPFGTTDTFCRGGFFIHGGSNPGSIGCIDLTSDMDRFAKDLKRLTGGKDCQIHLTVAYSG